MKKIIKNQIIFLFMVLVLNFIIQDDFKVYGAETPSINTTNISIYCLEDWAKDYISIPEDYLQQYQIKVSNASKVSYRIISGESVKVSDTGLVMPNIVTYYWTYTGNYYVGTTMPDPEVVYDKITNKIKFGTSVIQITADGETFNVTTEVIDYATVYADKIIDDYVSKNFVGSMTVEEIMKKVCELPASYNYSADYSGYASMIVTGGGDCLASTSLILKICDKLGYEAKSRNASKDFGAGSGHRNVLVTIGEGDYYELDAGYSGKTPRYYSVSHRTTLFSYSYNSEGATVYQYDGKIDKGAVLEIPKTVDSKTVIGIGEEFLSRNYDVSEVILPDSIKTIAKSAFNSCESLETLHIPESVTDIGGFVFSNCNSLKNFTCSENNPNYKIENGILYDKTGKTALYAPYCENAKISEQTEIIADYVFYYNNNIKEITVSEKVKTIGEGAFAVCKNLSKVTLKNVETVGEFAFAEATLKDGVYFEGDAPVFSENSFYRVSTTAYYPASNSTWTEDVMKDYGGNITWKEYTPAKALKGTLKVNGLTNSQTVTKGTKVTLTASGSGGSGSYTYSYIVYNKTTDKWFRMANDIESDTFTWVAGSVGDRVFYVDVKDSEGTIVRSSAINVNIISKDELSVKVTVSASNITVGDRITFNATATGGSGNYTYSYIVYNKDTGIWFRLADNIASNTFEWTAGSVGNRVFYIDVKDGEGTIVRSSTIEVTTVDESVLRINGSTTSGEVVVGETVTIKGIASGGTAPYTYSILVHNKANDSWYRFGGFSNTNELIWIAPSVGEREFFVEVKDGTDKDVRSSAIVVNVK